MKNGPFEVLKRKAIYQNPWISVTEDEVVGPGGEEGIFGTIDYKPGVAIVALNNQNEIYLIKEYYYVLGEEGIQTPAGGIDERETPLDAAKRELREETGCASNNWIDLGYINPFTMIIKSPVQMFLALDVEVVDDQPEDKLVRRLTVPFSEAYTMVMESKITLSASCVAILKAKYYLDEQSKTTSGNS